MVGVLNDYFNMQSMLIVDGHYCWLHLRLYYSSDTFDSHQMFTSIFDNGAPTNLVVEERRYVTKIDKKITRLTSIINAV